MCPKQPKIAIATAPAIAATGIGSHLKDQALGGGQAERHNFEREWKAPQDVDALRAIGDDDDAVGRDCNDLLAQQGTPTAFDEPQLLIDLVGAIDRQIERRMLIETTGARQEQPVQVMTADTLIEAEKLVRHVPIGESVVEGILTLVRAGRPEETDQAAVRRNVAWGPGPRASQALALAARARALLDGRLSPSLDDVVALARPVLKHRMALSFAARADGAVPDSAGCITAGSERTALAAALHSSLVRSATARKPATARNATVRDTYRALCSASRLGRAASDTGSANQPAAGVVLRRFTVRSATSTGTDPGRR